jgi:hypothetical protein
VVAAKKVDKAHAGFAHSLPLPARLGKRWPWPAAALVIILLSLLLWGGIAAIALVAFN